MRYVGNTGIHESGIREFVAFYFYLFSINQLIQSANNFSSKEMILHYFFPKSIVSSCWFTSDRNTIRFVDDNYVFILVQHASVEVFGQHVRVNVLKLHAESFQLRHPFLLNGHRRLCRLCLRPLLLDLPCQVDRSQSGFLSRLGARSVFSGGGLTPAERRCCHRTPAAVCPCFDPREDGGQAGSPATNVTCCSPTTVHSSG